MHSKNKKEERNTNIHMNENTYFKSHFKAFDLHARNYQLPEGTLGNICIAPALLQVNAQNVDNCNYVEKQTRRGTDNNRKQTKKKYKRQNCTTQQN